VSSAEESLDQAELLLARLEAARERLETASPEEAIDVLQELADLAKQIEAALQSARRSAEADAADA
jgi:hypothetical protein